MANNEAASPEEIADMRSRWNQLESAKDIKGLGNMALGGAAAAQEQTPESNDK